MVSAASAARSRECAGYRPKRGTLLAAPRVRLRIDLDRRGGRVARNRRYHRVRTPCERLLPRGCALMFQTAWKLILPPGASVRDLAIRGLRDECQTCVESESTLNPSLVEFGEIVTDWPLVFFRVSVIKTVWPSCVSRCFVATLAETSDGVGGVGEGVDGPI